jgi:hypothetical protein
MEFSPMESISLMDCAAAAAVLVAGVLTVGSGSLVVAQDAGVPKTAQPRSGDPYVPLPPHAQPREAYAPDNGVKPSAKEKEVDRKINNICRGC